MSDIIITTTTDNTTETAVIVAPRQHGPATPWGPEAPKATKKFFSALVKTLVGRLENRRPEGKTDNGGRWYPSAAEDRDNFSGQLRTPSRAWPWSYWKGAKTIKHTKALVLCVVAGDTGCPEDIDRVVLPVMSALDPEVREFVVKLAREECPLSFA